MTSPPAGHSSGAGETAAGAIPTRTMVRWLVGVRILAVSALLVGALVTQSLSDEILPIAPLAKVSILIYALSLVWLALLILRVNPRLNAALQLLGDLVAIAFLIYFTGGVLSPFPFLFLITVSLAALLFGLRGALTVAGGAFVLYGAMAVATLEAAMPVQTSILTPALRPSNVGFQLFLTGAGFALVALLTSYLAHTRQRALVHLIGEREAAARLLALSGDVVRSVASGVVATDTDSTVVLANPAAHRLLRIDDDMVGRTLPELVPLDTVTWATILDRVRDHPADQVRLEAAQAITGTPLGITITPLLSSEGQPLGLVAHFQDLTETREAARRERLRERMVAIGQMSAGIAHEIRNPLASISGAAQVLTRASELGHSQLRLLRIIVDESRRLSHIIEEYLNYARPPEPRVSSCDIKEILEETLTLFSHSHEVTSGHRIDAEVEPCGRLVRADEGLLRQSFFNLAQNAIQAMPTGGVLRIEARTEDDHYVIRWRDQGVGMSSTEVDEIFQPFTAFRTGGTGLGLAVVYSVITELGGDIQVDSTPGHGTLFTLSIPLEAG